MATSQESAVRVLNSLIETTLDSAHGYAEAAESAREGQLKSLFAERSRRRLDLARQLQQEVRTFGETPRESQSMLGKAHDRFVELKAAIMGGRGEKAVIDEVERGEDVMKAQFKKAIKEAGLPANAREVVNRAYESIRIDRDEISLLKRQIH